MPAKKNEYRRLPGRGLRRSGSIAVTRTSCRAFLGSDHLLCIDASGFAEDYRRFYYRDIQAVVIRKTDRGKVWNVVLGVLMAVAAAITWFVAGGAGWVSWLPTAFFGLFLLINLLRGPTCVCHLRTAVHTEELPSVNRLRVARKFLGHLLPPIVEAQGPMSRELIEAGLGRAPNQPNYAAPLSSKAPVRSVNAAMHQANSGYTGLWHWVLFGLLLADAAETGVAFFVRHVALALVGSLFMGGLTICTVLALVRQTGSRLSNSVRGVTWAILGYMILNLLFGYVLLIAISVREPGIGNDQWRYLQIVAEMSPLESPWILALFIYSFACSLSLGLMGLLALRGFRAQPSSAAAAVASTPAPMAEPTAPKPD